MKLFSLQVWRDALESCESYDDVLRVQIALESMAEYYDPVIVEYIHAKIKEHEKLFV